MNTLKRDNLICLSVVISSGLFAGAAMLLTNPMSMWLSIGVLFVAYWIPIGFTIRWYSKKYWHPKESIQGISP